jgi:predicted small secreted protein
MKLIKNTFFVLFAVVVLAGCSTIEGVGKDIQKLGGSIEKSAK